jgi:hypothetical protein
MTTLLDRWNLTVRAAGDPGLPLMARALLPLVLEGVNRQTGACAYAVRTFAAKIKTHPKRIRAALSALANAGYLTIEDRGGEITSNGKTNAYRPIFATVANDTADEGTQTTPRMAITGGHKRPLDTVDEGTESTHHEGTQTTPIPTYSLSHEERKIERAIAPAANKTSSTNLYPFPTGGTDGAPAANKVEGKIRGTRLPADWTLPAEWRAWAVEWLASNNRTVDIDIEAESFRDHWTCKAGQAALHVQWVGVWRNWIRRARQNNGKPYRGAGNQAGRANRPSLVERRGALAAAAARRLDSDA